MYNLQAVTKLEKESSTALKVMKMLVKGLTEEVDLYRLDGSRSAAFVEEQTQRLRDKAMPAISKQFNRINEIAQELQTQKPFYESKPLLLSCETFDDDPAKDAAIRMSKGRELAAAPLSLLRLYIKSAAADKDLPAFYQGYLAANARLEEFQEAGGLSLYESLDAVDVENQLLGIAAISQTWANSKEAEGPLVDAVGSRQAPHKRLHNINARDLAQKEANDNRTAATAATAARAGL